MNKVRVANVVLNNFKNDSRVLKESVTLQKAGYDVTVVALHEASLREGETVQGVRVHRIRLVSRNWPRFRVVQLFKYLEFVWRAIKMYREVDILHCNDLNTLPIGVIIKKWFNKKVKIVYDAHEYEINDKPGQRALAVKMNYLIEKTLIRHADTVITVSGGIADAYVRLYGIVRPTLVLNAPMRQSVERKNIFRETFGIGEDQTIFLYQGSLSPGRGIEAIIKTFQTMRHPRRVLVLMGYGPLADDVAQVAQTNENIFYHTAVSPDIVLDYTASADIGLSLIENSSLSFYYCLPNKLFEYAMAGLPMIVSDLYEMRRIVEKYEVGAVMDSEGESAFDEAVKKIDAIGIERLRQNLKHFVETFNWQNQEESLLNVYRELK
jgi:glycosyltransferase involved in cell wall biosynthesis